MARKRDIVRPYPPAYVSAQTLAYLLDVAPETVDDWARRGHLPEPLTVATQRRWRWIDIEHAIGLANGLAAECSRSDLADDAEAGLASALNAFDEGVSRVRKAAGASSNA